jgi:flagellar hook-associated protein 1 FlgK
VSLNAALSIAGGGLSNVSLGLSLLSQNIANASTPQYALESTTQTSLSAYGQDYGVQSGLVVRATDPGLQNQVSTQTAQAAASSTISTALSGLEPALGTVGSNNDLGSLLSNVQSAFSALLGDPADSTQQVAVVNSAATLAQGINTLAGAYGTARQTAENGVLSGVSQLNAALAALGALNQQVVSLKAQGISVADLQNQQAQVENTISGLVDVNFVTQSDGGVAVLTAGGAQLPTDGSETLQVQPATVGPTTYYTPGGAGGIGGITLGGVDITAQLTGGSIGANITLRDTTLPTYQAGLDEFSEDLSSRFAAQGLTLFSNGAGAVPTPGGPPAQAGYVGYANEIQVNPAVSANPALVRDGTQAIAGSATGASAFTPNPTGLSGFSTLITRVLTYALGSQVQSGVPQTPIATTGLGPTGTLSSGFSPQTALGDGANALTASQASDSARASTQAGDDAATQSSLQTKLTSSTGVDLDTELGQLVVLQNAYGANAKVITAIENVFADVLALIPT